MDDPVRVAAAYWNLAHALLCQPGAEAEAADVAGQAEADLARTGAGVEAMALRGALGLVAVVARKGAL